GGNQAGGGTSSNNRPGANKNQRFDGYVNQGSAGTPDAAPADAPTSQFNVRKLFVLLLFSLLLLLLVVPSIARVVGRRRRWRNAITATEQATAAWTELRACAIDARVAWIDGLSPRATARLLRTEAGGLATAELRALDRIVAAVERASYAADARGLRAATLRDDTEEIRAAL